MFQRSFIIILRQKDRKLLGRGGRVVGRKKNKVYKVELYFSVLPVLSCLAESQTLVVVLAVISICLEKERSSNLGRQLC